MKDLRRPAAHPRTDTPWWRTAVIYPIYIRSFADVDGDGIGDRPRPIGRDVDHVFLARDGRPLTSAAIPHALRRLGGRAGLDGVRTNPHTFRHTFAKLYLLNGGDLFSLQEILGHTNLDMVRRYSST